MSIIKTARLYLIPATPEFLELLIAGDNRRAGQLLGLVVPDGWPENEEARKGLALHLQAMREDAAEELWRIRLMALRQTRRLIGSINLKGPPRANGDVEIGWGVSPEYQRQGFATEAARAVIEWAFSQKGLSRIIATIPSDNLASMGVALRLGMRLTDELRRNLPVWELTDLRLDEVNLKDLMSR